jgi:hypothetical protein
MTKVRVTTGAELLKALTEADEIEVDGSLSGVPMITLRPGVTLRGGTLRFGAKGILLTADNTLEDVTVLVPDWEVAIGNDTGAADLGRLALRGVRTRGQVLLLADSAVHAGHVEVDGLTVASADLRGRAEVWTGRPARCTGAGHPAAPPGQEDRPGAGRAGRRSPTWRWRTGGQCSGPGRGRSGTRTGT